MKKAFTIITIMLLGIGNFSYAQEIETLWGIEVTTASKSAEKISDAPGIVSVVSKEEIANFGSTSLSDVLNRLTSMYMIHAGTFTWNVASIRGQNISFFDTHTLVLVNGRPMRDGITGGMNSVFYNAFPVESIERIEIIRGPGSVLYGSNAYAGVINIITSKADEETHFQASVMAGSFGTKNVNFGGGVYINDDLNINIGGRWYDDDGSDFGGVSGISFKGQEAEKRSEKWTKDNKSIFINVNYKSFSLSASHLEMNPFALIPPLKWKFQMQFDSINTTYKFKAGDEVKLLKHNFVDLGYTHEFSDKYSFAGDLTFNGRDWMGQVNIFDTVHPDGHMLYIPKGKSMNALAEVTFQGNPMENLNFVVGGTFDFNLFAGGIFGMNVVDGDTVPIMDSHKKLSAYLQADYTMFDKLKVIVGGQLNQPLGYKANFSPRFGAIFNANDNLGFKALYSTAFRSPYPQETNVRHAMYFGNKDLKPELITTMEVQGFYQNEKLYLSLTGYRSHLSNLIKIQFDPDHVYDTFNGKEVNGTFKNIGVFDFTGIEFEGKVNITDQLIGFANFTYQINEGDQDKDGNTFKNAAVWPNMMAKVGLMYTNEKFSAGIFNSYFGQPTSAEYIAKNKGMTDETTDEAITQTLNPKATAYNLLSFNANIHLFKLFGIDSEKELTLGFYGDNLLDESIWFPEFATYMLNTLPLHTGRAMYGKLSFKF
jgi:outer membrane receptor for ferrienterochelin and colicin